MTEKRQYAMTLSLNVLNHLGIGLYSNIPAVLSEIVANAWDADATRVDVSIDRNDGVIEVVDNGSGMTVEDINNKFLKVGYQRRKDASETPTGRPVMGRKGIGKLAAFSIARIVEVHTIKTNPNALQMDREAIKAQITHSESSEEYFPDAITPDVGGMTTGTRLVLRDLDKNLTSAALYLRKRLARRFSIIGPSHKFSVIVDKTEITPEDRDFFKKLEFVWHFGNPDVLNTLDGTKRVGELKSEIETPNGTQQVDGWIGTVDRPRTLDDVNNSIVLLSRGRLVHENMLPDFKEAGVYAQYVVGEINADFLDDDDGDDMVTSGRQSVKEDDPRYEAVNALVYAGLREVKRQWTDLRKKKGKERALTYPSIKKWYDRRGKDQQTTAERLFGNIESLPAANRETKKELYKSTILAFEKFALQDMLSALQDVKSEDDFRMLSNVVTGIDDIEAIHYHEVTKGRLAVIRKLIGVLPTALEKILQELIYNHLWLLHPSLDRVTSGGRIEETVTAEFKKISAKLSKKEKAGRIDIRYTTATGKHVIVELKKHDKSISAGELLDQLQKYRKTLQKCLSLRFPDEPTDLEVIAILGKPPRGDDKENRQILANIDARYVTYDQLILEAERSYANYLEKNKSIGEVKAILEGLDADFKAGKTG